MSGEPEDRRTKHLGPNAADVFVRYLMDNRDKCAVVTGRIGAQPNVRYNGEEFQTATWAGHGVLMAGTSDSDSVHGLIQSGPEVEIEDVDETKAFVEAFERGELDREVRV